MTDRERLRERLRDTAEDTRTRSLHLVAKEGENWPAAILALLADITAAEDRVRRIEALAERSPQWVAEDIRAALAATEDRESVESPSHRQPGSSQR